MVSNRATCRDSIKSRLAAGLIACWGRPHSISHSPSAEFFYKPFYKLLKAYAPKHVLNHTARYQDIWINMDSLVLTAPRLNRRQLSFPTAEHAAPSCRGGCRAPARFLIALHASAWIKMKHAGIAEATADASTKRSMRRAKQQPMPPDIRQCSSKNLWPRGCGNSH